MGFSRQECWSGLPFLSPGDLPDSWIKPRLPKLQAGSLSTELQGKLLVEVIFFLPPLAVTKTCNLTEPKNMETRSTNSAIFLLLGILVRETIPTSPSWVQTSYILAVEYIALYMGHWFNTCTTSYKTTLNHAGCCPRNNPSSQIIILKDIVWARKPSTYPEEEMLPVTMNSFLLCGMRCRGRSDVINTMKCPWGLSLFPVLSTGLCCWWVRTSAEAVVISIWWEAVNTIRATYDLYWGFSGGAVVKNLPAKAGEMGDVGLIPGLRKSPGGGNGNPFQYCCLGNPMDRGAWQATAQGVPKSHTWLSTHPWITNGLYSYQQGYYIYGFIALALRCPE